MSSENNNNADTNVEQWFFNHRLPWSDDMKQKLDGQGVEYVEDLKILKRPVIVGLFEGATPVVKARADLAWKELGGRDTFEFKRCANSIPLEDSPPLKGKISAMTAPQHLMPRASARMVWEGKECVVLPIQI